MRFPLFISFLFLYNYLGAQVKKIIAETSVQNVTIFSSGARIERSASVTILAGRSEISFAGLSNQLEQQSVQLQADANITLLSVQSTKDFLTARKIEQEEKSFLERINSLKDKIDLDIKLLEVFKNEESMIIKNEAIGGQAGVKTEELRNALDLHRQRLTEIYQKELEISKRLLSEQQEQSRVRAQLIDIGKKKDSTNYIVTALVDSKEARNVKFQLLYNIKDAGWYPTYDVRVSDVTKPLTVLMNANVFQRSGETWKDVSLLLGTGNPNDNATPSPLQPWMLNYFDPYNPIRSQPQQGVAMGRVTDNEGEPLAGASVVIKGTGYAVATDANGYFKLQSITNGSSIVISMAGFNSKEIPLKAGYFSVVLSPSNNVLQEVTVSSMAAGRMKAEDKYFMKDNQSIQRVSVATQYQPTTIVYKIADKYTLETDGKTTTIGIKEFDVPAIYDYYTAPKIDQATFLTAKIINWQDYDLQSGEASLYFEGTFLGKTYLDLNATADTLALSLGKDNGIKISRKLVKEFSSKRFIGSNRSDSRQYEISLRNTKKVPVTIKVTDQFPVSTTKEINVEDVQAPEASIDKDSGIVTWTITLPPGQEKKLSLSFTVKYPKDKKVVLD